MSEEIEYEITYSLWPGSSHAGLILREPGGSKWTNNEETDDAE